MSFARIQGEARRAGIIIGRNNRWQIGVDQIILYHWQLVSDHRMKESGTSDLNHILESAKNGNEAAEEKLFVFLYVRFLYLAKKRIGGEDAKDIAQDACITILRKYKSFEEHRNFEGWAYKILRNHIGNYLQHKKVERAHIVSGEARDGKPADLSAEIDPTLKRKLLKCLRRLLVRNELYARVLNLVHLGFKTSEICGRMKITPNHCYVVLNRGRQALISCLEEGERDE